MTSGPITSQHKNEETMKTVRDFIFLGSQVTVTVTAVMKFKDACSLEETL